MKVNNFRYRAVLQYCILFFLVACKSDYSQYLSHLDVKYLKLDEKLEVIISVDFFDDDFNMDKENIEVYHPDAPEVHVASITMENNNIKVKINITDEAFIINRTTPLFPNGQSFPKDYRNLMEVPFEKGSIYLTHTTLKPLVPS